MEYRCSVLFHGNLGLDGNYVSIRFINSVVIYRVFKSQRRTRGKYSYPASKKNKTASCRLNVLWHRSAVWMCVESNCGLLTRSVKSMNAINIKKIIFGPAQAPSLSSALLSNADARKKGTISLTRRIFLPNVTFNFASTHFLNRTKPSAYCRSESMQWDSVFGGDFPVGLRWRKGQQNLTEPNRTLEP